MEKILEKSGNFVSPEKWEPWNCIVSIRWYVAPTEAMYDEARKQNTPVGKPEQKNNRSNITNRGMLPITQIKPVRLLLKAHLHSQKANFFFDL